MEFPGEVLAIGRLIGLLDGTTGNDAQVVKQWFADPTASIATAGTRLGQFAALAESALGPGTADPPPVFTNAQWYPLPTAPFGAMSSVHLVVAPPGAPAGEVGVGVYAPMTLGSLTVEPYLYVPLFSYDEHGTRSLLESEPAQVGLTMRSSTRFKADAVSFAALSACAQIFLADRVPTCEVQFTDLQGTAKPSTYNTLNALLDPEVLTWIGAIVPTATSWFQFVPGNSPHTIGEILVAAGFLSGNLDDGFALALGDLRGKSAKDIAIVFVFAALDAMAGLDDPLVPLPHGGIYIAHDQETGDYGIRAATQLALSAEVDLCLGTWFTDESPSDNWYRRTTGTAAEPGLSLMFLNRLGQGPITFAPGFSISSVGVNLHGTADAPLINVDGYTLNGAEVRASLAYEHTWSFGVAARLDGVGFPLGPGFTAAPPGGNPVVSNLLSSGTAPPAGPPSAVNPAFSAEAAYVPGHPAMFEVLDPQGLHTNLVWIPVQRRFGPIACQKIGLELRDDVAEVLFDGAVSIGAINLELDQLSVGVDLRHPDDVSRYTLDLQGLELTFEGGGVEVSGGLRKVLHGSAPPSYDGEALVKAFGYGLGAIGSFGALPDGGTSLFVFAWLDAPLGGPPFFYVTAVAAGFGYDRALKIPAQNDVQSFPLLAALSDPSKIGGNPATPNVPPAPQGALAAMDQWLPPQRGEYWLAAGLQFTTFEIITTNALLVVELGHDFVLAVLGVGTLKQPQSGDAYVYAELDIEAVFRPADGEARASAVLAPSSYVMAPEARLTGGFAFCAWYGDNPHTGDFVFTIGGYHPAFKAPTHYPQEPRVGINWRIGNTVTVVGDAYFAITPAAMMAGGGLALTFASGPLKAWLKVQIDVLLSWKPFYLQADASIAIGVSYHLQFGLIDTTLSIEVGAQVELWGPPFGFAAHIDWYIISFTIRHGSQDVPPTLTWADFKALLPTKSTPSKLAVGTAAPAFLAITASDGLVRQQPVGDLTHWLVRPGRVRFVIASAVPASSIVLQGSTGPALLTEPVAIRGVNGGIATTDYRSTQTITVLRLGKGRDDIATCELAPDADSTQPADCTAKPVDLKDWKVERLNRQLPQALWGTPVPASASPPLNADSPTVTGTVGVTMAPLQQPATNGTPAMTIDQVFADRVINPDTGDRLSISPGQPAVGSTPQVAASFTDIAHVNDVADARDSLFDALSQLGRNCWTNAPLPRMAADPGADFADEPMAGSTMAVGA